MSIGFKCPAMNPSGKLILMINVCCLLIKISTSLHYQKQCTLIEGQPAFTRICDISQWIFEENNASLPGSNTIHLSGDNKDEFAVNEKFELISRIMIDREMLIDQKKCKSQDNKSQMQSQIECILSVYLVLTETNKIIQIDVHILDVNDNVPRFDLHLASSEGLKFKLLEDPVDPLLEGLDNVPSLSDLGLMKKKRLVSDLPLAEDPDFSVNGSVTYSLEGQDRDKFYLDKEEHSQHDATRPLEHLRLFILGPIDYEVKSEYKVNLIAYNNDSVHGNYIPKSVLPITVDIQDINEYPPEFLFENNTSESSSFNLSIPESTPVKTRIFQVKTRDRDIPNSLNRYPHDSNNIRVSISQVASSNIRSTFRMNEKDGSLFLIKKLDYETGEQRYSIPILAVDSGYPPRTSTGTLSVSITDVNDEAPKIEFLSLTSPTQTGSIRTDTIPQFTITENLPLGTLITKIQVSDRDSGSGGRIDCNLSKTKHAYNLHKSAYQYPGEDEDFKLVKIDNAYHLMTNKIFDREQRDNYLLNIVCHDFGDEMKEEAKRLSSHRQVSVLIDDTNDNPPKFAKATFHGSVKEAATVAAAASEKSDEKILTLDVIDEDLRTSNENRFRISASSAEEILSYFSIDEHTGILTTNNQRPLDREVCDVYEFTVEVYDQVMSEKEGWPISSANVTIRILDMNDNPPELLSPAVFEVPEQDKLRENVNQKIFIGKLEVGDKDLAMNGEVNYKINGNPNDELVKRWSIRSDGSIYAHVNGRFSLDREEQASHLIPIILEDRGQDSLRLSTSITATVILSDVNDNSPIFERPPTEGPSKDRANPLPTERLRISIETEVDTVIYQAHAQDIDEGRNSKVTYEIQNNELTTNTTKYFQIDENTGQIRLTHTLSMDDVRVPRKLIIIASDSGEEQVRKSFAFLFIEMVTKEMAESEEKMKHGQKMVKENNNYFLNGGTGEMMNRMSTSPEYNAAGGQGYSITEIAIGLGIGLILIMAICLSGIISIYFCNSRGRIESNSLSRMICCGLCKEQAEGAGNLKFKTANPYQTRNCNYETLNVIKTGQLSQAYYSRAKVYPDEYNDNNWYQTASRMKKSDYDFIVQGVKKTPTMSSINGVLRQSNNLVHPIPRRLPAGFSAIPNPEEFNDDAYVYSTTLNNTSPTTVTSGGGEDKSHQNTSSSLDDKRDIECGQGSPKNGIQNPKHHAGYVIGSPNYSSSFV